MTPIFERCATVWVRSRLACGVAFGIDAAKQRIGDVLISEHIIPYELSKTAGATFILRSERPPASSRMRDWLRNIDIRQQANATWPTLRAGAVLTGDKLVDDKNYRDELVALAANDMIVGGEMEAAGLHHALARDHVDWIVIKAICDWGDGNKSNTNKKRDQKLAATNAASVTVALLTSNLIEPPLHRRSGAHVPVDAPTATFDPLEDCDVAEAGQLDVLRDRQKFAEQKGRRTQLAALHASAPHREADEADTVIALDELYLWATTSDSRPFYALLGESGIGKTTHSQRLIRRLLDERNTGSVVPVAVYFDLRKVNPGSLIAGAASAGTAANVPLQSISERVMTDCIANGWVQVNGRLPSLREVQNAIDGGAIVVFDGLDEILARIDDGNGLTLTSGLLRTLEESRSRGGSPQPAAAPDDRKSPKLLISCRTQFFRTLAEQEERLTGERRDAAKGQLFEAMELLPLTEAQIRDYLQRAMPTADIEHVMVLIDSVHNLRELAERPFTLTLVEEFLPDVEQWAARGEKITGARLYGTVVERWLLRDKQKQVLAVEDKRQLMMLLARKLATDGALGITAHSLEQWFDHWLHAQGPASRYHAHPRELLYSDVRNSTVLKRSDDANDASNSRFEFAHTSLFEYFLACSLLDGVRRDDREAWAIRLVSDETLTFFGELLTIDPQRDQLLQTLDNWRLSPHALASRVQLEYALRAYRTGLPQPATTHFNLAGVDLRGWTIGSEREPLGAAPDEAPRFPLPGANFEGAKLLRTRFWACDLNNAKWQDADTAQAEALACRVMDKPGEGSVFPAAISQRWLAPRQNTNLVAPRPAGFAQWGSRGHHGGVSACAFSADGQRIVSAGSDGSVRLWNAATGHELRVLSGHASWVRACAFSVDGQRIVSAGMDGSVRVWDAGTGREERKLIGHAKGVSACAFSVDGQRIVSAGGDGSVRLWDAATGREERELIGHAGPVRACVFSADGQRIVSAGDDGSVRVWDAATGREERKLIGHSGAVRACALSADGQRIVSAGSDGTVRLWDAATGSEERKLIGHAGGVAACAFSADGQRIVSAGSDRSVRLWDAATGHEERKLTGHAGGISACAFSADSQHIVSAGGDGSIRLWDAATGKELRAMLHATDASAAWSSETGELIHASGRAWRYIAAQYRDENDALQVMELPEAWERKGADAYVAPTPATH